MERKKIYEKEINELIAIIQSHRDRAYRKINEELVGMYIEIGKYLSTKIKTEKWGSKIVENISRKIMELYPYLKGFDKRGLYRMIQFYETYGHNIIVSSLLTQISWTNNVVILSSTKTIEEKEYPDMSFSNEDMYLIIKVQRSNPIYGSYYKKRKK